MTPFMDERVAEWVAARIPRGERGFGPNVSMGVASGGKLVAGLVFHNWDPEAGVIECSAASVNPGWATRSVLRQACEYVFNVAGCQMLVGRTAPDNLRARRLWAAMGAVEHSIPRLRGRDQAEIIMCVTDDAWNKSKLNGGSHG